MISIYFIFKFSTFSHEFQMFFSQQFRIILVTKDHLWQLCIFFDIPRYCISSKYADWVITILSNFQSSLSFVITEFSVHNKVFVSLILSFHSFFFPFLSNIQFLFMVSICFDIETLLIFILWEPRGLYLNIFVELGQTLCRRNSGVNNRSIHQVLATSFGYARHSSSCNDRHFLRQNFESR